MIPCFGVWHNFSAVQMTKVRCWTEGRGRCETAVKLLHMICQFMQVRLVSAASAAGQSQSCSFPGWEDKLGTIVSDRHQLE